MKRFSVPLEGSFVRDGHADLLGRGEVVFAVLRFPENGPRQVNVEGHLQATEVSESLFNSN